jgi:hypothetical protein
MERKEKKRKVKERVREGREGKGSLKYYQICFSLLIRIESLNHWRRGSVKTSFLGVCGAPEKT